MDGGSIAVVAPYAKHVAEVHGEGAGHGLDELEAVSLLDLQARDVVLIEKGQRSGVAMGMDLSLIHI